MKVLIFDLLYAQPLGGAKFHGGGEYIKSVFEALSQVEGAEYRLEICYNQNEFIDDWIKDIILEKNIPVHQVVTTEDIIHVVEKEDKENLRFFTGMIYPYSQVKFPDGVKTFGVCHGLRGLEKPYDREAFLYISNKSDLKECIRNTILWKRTYKHLLNYYTEIFQKFDTIITDSQHSKCSIKVNFPEIAAQKEILVLYAPSKHAKVPAAEESKEPYIMMISANRWLKNCSRGVVAIDRLYSSGHLKGVKTRVYGNLPVKIRRKLKYSENFVFYNYVSSEELERAYQNCSVFFYPTLNEGFGLPPLEAMKYGRTCVISAVCSLPEIYGDAVYYCNPYDLMEMGNRILCAIENPIPQNIISQRTEEILKKQTMDLGEICKLIFF